MSAPDGKHPPLDIARFVALQQQKNEILDAGERPPSTASPTPSQHRPDVVDEPSARNVGGTASLFTERRESPSDIPGGRSSLHLEDVLATFCDLLFLPDTGAIKVALAAVVGNY